MTYDEVWVFTKENFQLFIGQVVGGKPNKEKLNRMLHIDEVAKRYRTTGYMREGNNIVHDADS